MRHVKVERISSVGTEELEERLSEITAGGDVPLGAIKVLALQTNDPAITKYILIYPQVYSEKSGDG